MTRSKHALPPINAADFSIHAGPLVSHKAAMIVNAMIPPMMCIDHWHEVLTQDTGCVVFNGSFAFEPECLSDIASDVTRIAPPMAFCRGVSEQPVSSDIAMASASFIDPPLFAVGRLYAH
jgi:hypothetical protein